MGYIVTLEITGNTHTPLTLLLLLSSPYVLGISLYYQYLQTVFLLVLLTKNYYRYFSAQRITINVGDKYGYNKKVKRSILMQ